MNQSRSSRGGLILSAVLLGGSFIGGVIANDFHPSGIDPNNHPLVFVQYARRLGWTADHLGWFVAMTIMIAGFLVLIDALNVRDGIGAMAARLATVVGGAAIAITALREAVDGVVLKRAVDAWVSAPAAEQASRFAAAEVARWMEEAAYSYQSFIVALMLIVLAALIIATARVPRPIGYILVIAAGANSAVGWISGEAGFAPQGATPAIVTELAPLVCSIYLFVVALRMPRTNAQSLRTGGQTVRDLSQAV